MSMLGIVGGIAPGSSVDYYRLLIEHYRAARPDGSYPAIVLNSIDMQRFLALVEAPDRGPLIEYLLGEVGRLARAGADFGLFASNTPHLVFDEVAARSPIPLLSIVEATALAVQSMGLKHLGLLGTRFTMEGGFYPAVFARLGLRVTTPDPDDREYVHNRYFAELVHGVFHPATRLGMLAVIERLQRQAGIDGVILGGTELPFLFRDGEAPSLPLLDTTRIHVERAVAALLADPWGPAT
jgi:aspartate racemase